MSRVGVSLDFFGTLAEIDQDVPTIGQELTAMGFFCSSSVERIWSPEGHNGFRTCRAGLHNYERWRRIRLLQLCKLVGVPAGRRNQIVDYLIEADRKWTVRRTLAADQILAAIKDTHVEWCILSNWDFDMAPYLQMCNLPASTVVVSSCCEGVRKPNQKMFGFARSRLGVPPRRHIHVGDDWSTDVVGAVRSGGLAVWVSAGTQAGLLPARVVRCSPQSVGRELRVLIDRVSNGRSL